MSSSLKVVSKVISRWVTGGFFFMVSAMLLSACCKAPLQAVNVPESMDYYICTTCTSPASSLTMCELLESDMEIEND